MRWLSALLVLVSLACGAPPRTHVPETGFRTVEANGLTLAYFEEGTGPLVIMLHGFPDTARSWDPIRPRVAAAGYRVVTPFLRGYTPSGIPEDDKAYTGKDLGQDILAIITALGETRAFVVGHDFGAAGAYAAALLDPSKVRALVTIAIPHPGFLSTGPDFPWKGRHFLYLRAPGAQALMRRDDFQHVEDIYKRWSPKWSPDASELEPVKNAFAMDASLKAALDYYKQVKLNGTPEPFEKKVTVATLAFAGETDGVLGPDAFDDAKEGFEAEYTVKRLPGGHFCHREDMDAFLNELLPFLASH